MHIPRLVSVALFLGSVSIAQSPPAVLHSTSEYLFVLQGDRLLQYDLHSLALLHETVLPDRAKPGVRAETRAPARARDVARDRAPEEARDGAREPSDPSLAPPNAMVRRGLDWIVGQQRDDGAFPGTADPGQRTVHEVGVTALAALALMGEGSTLREGVYREPLKRAITWLRDQQDQRTGQIGTANCNEFIYHHAIAALALSEARGRSESNLLTRNAQKAMDYLEFHRNPYLVWRYQPHDGDNDTSITTWCTLALRSGQDFGLNVNPQALDNVHTWIDQMTDPVTGRTGYTERGGFSSRRVGEHSAIHPREQNEAMTAAGMLCRMLVGERGGDAAMLAKQAKLLVARPPQWERGRVDEYAWYFGSLAANRIGGDVGTRWNRGLRSACERGQRADGSFEPLGVWAVDGGPVYSTALLCLALEAERRADKSGK